MPDLADDNKRTPSPEDRSGHRIQGTYDSFPFLLAAAAMGICGSYRLSDAIKRLDLIGVVTLVAIRVDVARRSVTVCREWSAAF